MLENIIYFTVYPLTLLSNYRYILFALKTTTFTTDSSRVNFLSDSLQKFKWNEMSEDMFRNTLNSSETFTSTEQLINKFCDLKHAPEQINVDEIISSTTSIIMRVANSCLTQKQVKRKGRSNLNNGAFKKRKKWYDYSCSEARKIFESAAKTLSCYPKDPVVRGKYIKCKKQYKTLVKEKKRAFRENILEKMQQLEEKNSKEFKNLVRGLRSKKGKNLSDNIDPEIWYAWFKKLNDNNDTLSDDTYRPIIINLREFVPQFVKMLDKPIDVDEINKTASKLKNGKSVGIDLISNEMIKCCVDSHFVRLISKGWCLLLTRRQFSSPIRLSLEESLGLLTISLSLTLY